MGTSRFPFLTSRSGRPLLLLPLLALAATPERSFLPLSGGGQGANEPHPPAAACLPPEAWDRGDLAQADSLLAQGLDNEALFTVLPPEPGRLPLKPISTLSQPRLSVARTGSEPGVREAMDPTHPDLASAAQIHRIARQLSCHPLQVVVTPFRIVQDSVRTLQVVITHQGSLDGALARDASFWGQWGITPGADPATVVSVVEHAEAGDRFRGYGYLFGYPEHAVTFFTDAAAEMARTGEFVERDFLQLPVHSGQTGRFVYAVPRGHVLREEDEALLHAAAQVLERYRGLRPAFENSDGTLRALELLFALLEGEMAAARPGPAQPGAAQPGG